MSTIRWWGSLIIAFALLVQRHILRGMTLGAVKG